VWLFFPPFFSSLGCFARFFYLVFRRLVTRGVKKRGHQKKQLLTSIIPPPPPPRRPLIYVSGVFKPPSQKNSHKRDETKPINKMFVVVRVGINKIVSHSCVRQAALLKGTTSDVAMPGFKQMVQSCLDVLVLG
jgi:hypothetical protein